jgi:putative peptidoglycan lipid II flippase
VSPSARVATGILLSRIAGLVRERVIAHYLGVSLTAEAFRAALRIPNLLQNLLGEGVLSASFVPVYARLVEEGDERAGRVAGAVAGLLTTVVAVVVLAGMLLAGPLVNLLTPGFTGEKLELTVTLTRIMFAGVGFLVLSAWCIGVLNSHRRFFLSYVAPVLWNMAMVAAVVAAALGGPGGRHLAIALAWGAVAGGALQLGVQVPAVLRLVGHFRPSLNWRLPEVRDVARRLGPVVTGRGSVQLLANFDLVLASLLALGAVAALGYAQIFYVLPISLFGMSAAAAELPELSRQAGDLDALRRRLNDVLGRMAFYVVPTVVAYIVAGDLIVGLLLQTGRFGPDDTTLVWLVVGAYSVGLLAATSSRLLQSALYALGDTRTPAVASVVRFAVAAGAGALLMFQFDRLQLAEAGVTGLAALPAPLTPLPEAVRTAGGDLRLGAMGLALASGASAWLERVWLARRLRATLGPVGVNRKSFARVVVAAAVAGAVAVGLRIPFGGLTPPAAAAVVGVPAAATYALMARSLGVEEATRAWTALRVRVRRT